MRTSSQALVAVSVYLLPFSVWGAKESPTGPADAATQESGTPLSVALSDHRGGLEAAQENRPARLHFSFRVKNNLAVALSQIEVGVAFASDPVQLERLDLGKAYAQTQTELRLVDSVVLRRRLPVNIGPGASESVRISLPMVAGWPLPQGFQVHVLSFVPQAFDGPLLMSLLATGWGADEVAVVELLGLGNQRWHRSQLAAELMAPVALPLGKKPSSQEVLHRSLGLLLLARTGVTTACDALSAFAKSPRLAAYDEPLQIIRSARFTSTYLEAPLAFVLPDRVRTMEELVVFAEALCREPQPLTWTGPESREQAAAATKPLAEGREGVLDSGRRQAMAGPEVDVEDNTWAAGAEEPPWWRQGAWLWVLALCLASLSLLILGRRRGTQTP